MVCECRRVGLDRIDTENSFYRLTTIQDKTSILESVARFGLLCPVVLKDTDGHLNVISGFRRIEACQQLQRQEIPCRILSDATPTSYCVELAITDNGAQRPLNLVEQARCLQLLDKTATKSKMSTNLLQSLGIGPNEAYAAKLRSVAVAPQAIQTGIVLGWLSLPIVLLLKELPTEDALAVTSLYESLPMGLNKQREVLLFLKEISARDGVPLKRLLEEESLNEILNNDNIDGNVKSRQLRAYLRKKRFPRLVEVEEAFHENVHALNLGGAIQVSPPPQFEGCRFTMTIRFDSLAALKKAHQKIATAIENPQASSLFDC